MKLNLGRNGEFIPSWNNNRELPEEEQIKVYYKRIVGEMGSELTRMNTEDMSMIFDNVKIVKKCVTNIENLIDVDGSEIRTAKHLLRATGTHGLVTEIGMHILNDSKLDESLGKKNTDDVALD